MSLLLNQPSKLCLRKPGLVRSSAPISNCLSPSLPQIPPHFAVAITCTDPCRPELVNLICSRSMSCLQSFYDTLEIAYERRKIMMKEKKIGSSHGWVATLKDDGLVCLQDELILNAFSSASEPKHIPLPPLVTLPHCQTQIVTNMAMSSSSPEEDDCVVAIKFLGPQLSFCRPAQNNSEWTNIRIENPCFFSSPVVFAEKDGMFRIPGSGGHLIGSWDLHNANPNPKFQRMQYQNLPKLTKTESELMDSCCRSEHLVESRTTGEMFLVKWYKKTSGKIIKGIGKLKTKALMVYKLDEDGNAVYTQDIGDLFMYFIKSDPFCVPTNSRRPLPPNRVLILDVDESRRVSLCRTPFKL